MESKHTPGPWRTGDMSKWGATNAVYVGREPEFEAGRRIALCFTQHERPASDVVDDEDRANARLIAAAPDLLEALKKLSAFVGRNNVGIIGVFATAEEYEAVMRQAHAAMLLTAGQGDTRP